MALDVNERAELERLRSEVAELRMDRQFLKRKRPFGVGECLESERTFEAIHAERTTQRISRMVELLKVSPQGYDARKCRYFVNVEHLEVSEF